MQKKKPFVLCAKQQNRIIHFKYDRQNDHNVLGIDEKPQKNEWATDEQRNIYYI